jgi:SAM-dependent methyltransferase
MAGLYDRPDLYDPVAGDSSEVLAFYAGLAGAASASILDVGCGSGRYAVPLAALGHRVTGVDISAPMLAIARHEAERRNLKLALIDADFRDFLLAGRTFDLAFSAANTLLHLATDDDLLRCLRSVGRHLPPGGRFAFDLFVPSPEILGRPPGKRVPLSAFEHPVLGPVRLEETTSYDAQTQMLAADWVWSDMAGRVLHDAHFELRQRFPDELDVLLALAPFRLVARYGDFDHSPFTAASGRQIYVLEALG